MSILNINRLRIEQLESVRGIAALLVVMYHIPKWNALTFDISLIRGAGLMVDLFFVLSGFVIYTAYNNKLNHWSDVIKFQFLRFGRLYPVHLFYILVFLGIETLKFILQNNFGIASHSRPPFVENNFSAFLREIFLIKAFWSNETAMAINSPAWSISAEFYTYVIFGLVTLLAAKFKQLIFLLLGLCGLLILIVLQPDSYNFMVRCITGFSFGCVTAILIQKKLVHLNAEFSSLMIPFSFAIIALVVIFTHGPRNMGLVIYPASALLIASIVLSGDNMFNSLLSKPWLVWLGTVSYSLYMSHGAVLWFYQQVLRVVFHPPEMMIGNLSVLQLSFNQALCAIAAYLMSCLIVAYFTFKLIEKPFREKSRSYVKIG